MDSTAMKTTMFVRDPVEDMETAKRLIAKYPVVDFHRLMAIAADPTEPQSARIAAIYTLGLTDDKGLSEAMLARIVGSATESAEVKDHAAEALESITMPE